MTTYEPVRYEPVRVGDVVEDSYGNPAVVVDVHGPGSVYAGTPRAVVQTVGSDRGRIASPGRIVRLVTDARADWARQVVRDLWPTLPLTVRQTAVRQSHR